MGELPTTTDQSQRMLLALKQARLKLEASERAQTEAIAIIGMGCRFPGGASDPERFWQLLRTGTDAVTEVPADRWCSDDVYDADPAVPGKTYARHGSFLAQVDQFDAKFFGISPREAMKLDPQQRLLLEVSWEALERSGTLPVPGGDNQTGVFVGVTTNDYARLLMPDGDLSQIDAYYLTGNPLNAMAGRLAYTLGLHGPCMAVDTACSSSLVALHLACQSLRQRECDQALAGGVNLMLTPENTIALSKAQILSADGRCKTFDASADGIVRGEGCGVVVLKRLSDAERDGDRILALIRGSAVNQDGASSGFTVPNKAAQEALLRQALKRARITPAAVDYIEAHGTGTPLGDPIEVRALATIFGESRPDQMPLRVGSVKTNLGHLESAAGIASLMKVVLALQHQTLPPHLHLQQLNPHVNWQDLPIEVPTEAVPWPRGDRPRLAGVSSFGASGTNAHVILGEAPLPSPPVESDGGERPCHLLALSGKTAPALDQRRAELLDYLQRHPDVPLADVGFTANTGRAHYAHRLALVAEDVDAAIAALQSGSAAANCVQGQVKTPPKIAFLFTGQGSQYVQMGRQLYETQPVFRQELDRCAELLATELEVPLLTLLYPDRAQGSAHYDEAQAAARLAQTQYTQPALFALEYALARLWQSWGVRPTVVMGHSIGEYVAACLAGVFSLADGLKLIAARGRLMQALPQTGSMIAVLANREQVQLLLAASDQGAKVAIAAINGPQSLVLSGPKGAIAAIADQFAQQGIKTKTLEVSHAFHSPLMAPMLAEFRAVAATVAYAPPRIKLISNLTGTVITNAITTPDYWCRHILEAVQFQASAQALVETGVTVGVEIGPKPILCGMGSLCVPENSFHWLPSLRPHQEDTATLLSSLAQLYGQGAAIDWRGFDRGYHRQRVDLPTYPFQRQRYWVETTRRAPRLPYRHPAQTAAHPLLGTPLSLAGTTELRFESYLTQQSLPYLTDHQLYGQVVFPATGYLEIAATAAAQVFQTDQVQLEAISIQQPLVLSDSAPVCLQVVLSPVEQDYRFSIFSTPADPAMPDSDPLVWQEHATGFLRRVEPPVEGAPQAAVGIPIDLTSLPAGDAIEVTDFYRSLQQRGFEYGPRFQGIQRLWRHPEETLGEIRLPADLVADAAAYHLHPAVLDACFQVLGTNFPDDNQTDIYIPTGVERLHLLGRLETHLWSRIERIHSKDARQQHLSADLQILNDQGQVVATVQGLSFRRASRKLLQRLDTRFGSTAADRTTAPSSVPPENWESWLYQLQWHASPLTPASVSLQGNWLIFCDRQGIGLQLAEQLRLQGARPILVFADASDVLPEPDHPDHYVVTPMARSHLTELLQSLPPCEGVVHLWSLDAPSPDQLEDVAGSQIFGCASVLHLVQGLTAAGWEASPRLWLVTRGAQAVGTTVSPVQVAQSSLWGLGRVIALEYPNWQCTLVDLDPTAATEAATGLLGELAIAPHQRDDQVAYREGQRYHARLAQTTPSGATLDALTPPEHPFRVALTAYGTLENLTFQPIQRSPLAVGEVEIQVRAVGLNFRDVLNALGLLEEHTRALGIADVADLPFGGECAGVITAVGEGVTRLKVGDSVIAAQTIGSLASYVNVPQEFVVCKPDNLSFEAAATIPTAFLTADYALRQKAQLQAGEKVLIHSAAGGVGQAAVQIAHRLGARVWGTASPGKWDFLTAQGVQEVMNSRTLAFTEHVLATTDGAGVDVVLNSLKDDYIPHSLAALGPQGRFVEIGKLGIWSAAQMQAERSDVAYFPFDLLDISLQTPSIIQTLLEGLMQEFQAGHLQPLHHKVFSIQNVVNAFRYMAQSRHIGKVVITLPKPTAPAVSTIRPDATYLITGGLGALGLQVAQSLVAQGARYLLLTGRRSPSETAQAVLQKLAEAGAQVVVVQADVAQAEAVATLLTTAPQTWPPIRGIFHAAGMLQDGMLHSQTWEAFAQVMAAKVTGTWNLHRLSQSLPLDYFVCFSSMAALLGSPGQGNYAAANAFMDALAAHRRHQGLPALSVNWGPWAESGMAAQLGNREQARWASKGVTPLSPQVGLEALYGLLPAAIAQVGVLPIDWAQFLRQFPAGMLPPSLQSLVSTAAPTPMPALRQELMQLPTSARRRQLLNHLQTELAQVLGLTAGEVVDPEQGLLDLGMDSLMAVELGNRLQTTLGCPMPPAFVFDYPTLTAMVDYLTQQLAGDTDPTESPTPLVPEPGEPEQESAANHLRAEVTTDVDALSDGEAEALLLSKLEQLRY